MNEFKNASEPSLREGRRWRFDSSSRLWLPGDGADKESAKGRSALFIAVTLGYRDVFGRRASWEDLESRLAGYNRARVLNWLGRLSFVLDQSRLPESRAIQERLIYAVFGPKGGRVFESYLALQTRTDSPVIVFHQAQLLTLAKAAYLIDRRRDNPDSSSYQLGEALLMATDFVDEEHAALQLHDYHSQEGNRRWQLYILANTTFNSADNLVHALARSYDLYLMDKPHLRTSDAYLDLPRLMEKATGCPPEKAWMALVAIAARWMHSRVEDHLEQDARIQVSSYFTTNFDFRSEEAQQFFALIAESDATLLREVQQRYRVGALRPFDTLPFARWPVVIFGDFGIPMSAPLVRQRLTTGLHHSFLDPGKFSVAEREQYLQYMGRVFEDYVHRLFVRALGEPGPRYIDGAALRAHAKGKVCDGAVRYPGAIVLFETKASLLSLDARTGQNWNSYRDRLNDIVIDAARQIDETIKAVERGHFVPLGLDGKSIRQYVPLVITLENALVNPLSDMMVREELRREGVLVGSEVIALQVMDIAELENAELALKSGRSLLDLVVEKANGGSSESFTNWWIRQDEEFMQEGHNEYLSVLYRMAGDRSQEELFRRQRSTERDEKE